MTRKMSQRLGYPSLCGIAWLSLALLLFACSSSTIARNEFRPLLSCLQEATCDLYTEHLHVLVLLCARISCIPRIGGSKSAKPCDALELSFSFFFSSSQREPRCYHSTSQSASSFQPRDLHQQAQYHASLSLQWNRNSQTILLQTA